MLSVIMGIKMKRLFFHIISVLLVSTSYGQINKNSGKIAFSITPRNDNNEIYVINADGTGFTQLTNHKGRDCAPAWSPDATKIAFYVHYDTLNTWSIDVMDSETAVISSD